MNLDHADDPLGRWGANHEEKGMNKRVLHCWANYRDSLPFGSPEWVGSYVTGDAICMLHAGHKGPHEWTPDDQITVSFR